MNFKSFSILLFMSSMTIRTFAFDLSKSLGEGLQKIADNTTQVVNPIITPIRQVAEPVVSGIGKVGEAGTEFGENMSQFSKSAAQDIPQFPGKVAEDLGPKIEDGLRNLGDSLSEVVTLGENGRRRVTFKSYFKEEKI